MSNETLPRKPLPPRLARRLTLRVVESSDRSAIGRAFPLDGTEWILGRDESLKSAIADRMISRRHVQIAPEGVGAYSVTDLETSNGTYLDGTCVAARAELTSGSVLSIGETLLVVDEEPDASSLPASGRADGSVVKELVGSSFAAERMRAAIATAAHSKGSVLLLGETGTGKEVAARAIHCLGPRASGPWVAVNCAAIPSELAESELFGHRKGAFTGAVEDRAGCFVQASGGTLFLDEVGELPLPLQAKLLRVLEERIVQPIGGGPSQSVDVRVVAATHKSLDTSDFRRDLMARLADWVLKLPSLVERRADVIPLWQHFVRLEAGAHEHEMTAEFAEGLLLHSWPMNVRELQRLARRLVALAEPGPWAITLLPETMQARLLARDAPSASSASSPAVRAQPVEIEAPEAIIDRTSVESALNGARGNVRQASQQLKISRSQLYRWLQKNGIDPDDFRT